MGKKKPFIDKKNASTYHLLHRSQRDVGGVGGGCDNNNNNAEDDDVTTTNEDRVLWPTEPQNLVTTDRAVLFGSSCNSNSATAATAPTTTTANSFSDTNHVKENGKDAMMSAWRSQLQQVGLLDDTDYEKYLKPITGTGTFLDGITGRPVALVAKPPPSQGHSTRHYSTTTTTATATTTAGLKKDDTNSTDLRLLRHAEEALVEVHRQLDSIPLTASCMDDDIAAILFGDYDEGDYEELNDDFIFNAAAAALPEATTPSSLDAMNDKQQAFDFDKHIQQLIAKAKLERSFDATLSSSASQQQQHHYYGQQDQVYFANLRPLHEMEHDDDDDDYHGGGGGGGGTTVATEPGVVAKLNPAEERALCEKFEATLAEYEDDEDDDCYGSDDDNNNNNGDEGLLPLEGNAVVEAVLDDYLQEREDEIFMQGRASAARYANGMKQGAGGSGFSILVGTQMVPAKTLDDVTDHPEQEVVVPLSDLFQQARDTLAVPKQKPPPEEVFFDGQSYFSERQRNPWDCESVLSTYSNLDNNPTTIDGKNTTSRRRRRRTQKQVTPLDEEKEEEEPVQIIRLSTKTGLPIGVLDKATDNDNDDNDDDGLEDTVVSVNRGVGRNRTETLLEKKARKWQIKRERELARLQKKVTRQVFQEEFQKRAVDVSSNDIAGKTVFRFS